MVANFFNNRLIIATTVAVMLHVMAFEIFLDKKVTVPIAANLFSNNISINLSKLLSKNPKKVEKQEKLVMAEKSFKKSVPEEASSKNQEIVSNEIPVTSNFKLKGERMALAYPKRSLHLKQEGVVYLKVLVSDTGVTQEIIFTKRSNYNLLNKAALKAVKGWKFKPSIINGVATASWIEVPIEFKIV